MRDEAPPNRSAEAAAAATDRHRRTDGRRRGRSRFFWGRRKLAGRSFARSFVHSTLSPPPPPPPPAPAIIARSALGAFASAIDLISLFRLSLALFGGVIQSSLLNNTGPIRRRRLRFLIAQTWINIQHTLPARSTACLRLRAGACEGATDSCVNLTTPPFVPSSARSYELL